MITKSAAQAYRQIIKRRAANIKKKDELRKVINNYKKLIISGNLESAKKELPNVYKKLDKSAKVNLIKKNKASRLKSRLTALLNKKK